MGTRDRRFGPRPEKTKRSARPPEAPAAGPNLVYGRRAVAELLKRAPGRIKRLLLQDGLRLPADMASLIERLKPATRSQTRDELDRLTSGGVHQGVAAELAGSTQVSLEELIQQAKKRGPEALLVVLDEVQDPHNVGAAFRAAEVFGAVGLVLTERRSADVTPVARKVSAGATELLPWCKVGNLQRAFKDLREAGFWIVCTALEAEARNLVGADLPRPMAVVFGSEGRGVRELTRKESDVLISIPMRGLIDSLNLSQAVSVVLYELLGRSEDK